MWTPLPSRGLREAGVAEVAQERARLGGHAHRVLEVRARLRVQVEAELVGMVDVVAADRPRMERDRAHLGAPADHGHLGGADLVGVATRRELDPRSLHVVRGALRDALLEEGVAAALLARGDHDARVHALRPALERGGPPGERPHDPVLDGEVVPDDVELRDRAGALVSRGRSRDRGWTRGGRARRLRRRWPRTRACPEVVRQQEPVWSGRAPGSLAGGGLCPLATSFSGGEHDQTVEDPRGRMRARDGDF